VCSEFSKLICHFIIVPVYQIVLGTLDTINSSDVEWVYRPYMNTTKKRKFLTD